MEFLKKVNSSVRKIYMLRPNQNSYGSSSQQLSFCSSVSNKSVGLEIQLGRGFDPQPEALELHCLQLVLVIGLKLYIFLTLKIQAYILKTSSTMYIIYIP